MASLHEISSLVAGLFVTALFYLQYKRYQSEASKQDLLDSFLNDPPQSQSFAANA